MKNGFLTRQDCLASPNMATTRVQSAGVSVPWTTMDFLTIEPRPVHRPIMVHPHDEVRVLTSDGTIIRWRDNGDVIRTTPCGEITTWWSVPTMSDIVNRPPEGVFCRFYPDGRVTMSLNPITWLWGPPVTGEFTEGIFNIASCTCINCEDEIMDWDDCRQYY